MATRFYNVFKQKCWAVVGTVLCFVCFYPTDSNASPHPADKSFYAKVSKVVDGDTIDVIEATGSIIRVRIYGVNAPERWEPCFSAAYQFTRQLVLGKIVKILSKGRGKYDRLLGFVFTKKHKSLGIELVKAGMARVYSNQYAPQNIEIYRRYQVAQIYAMSRTLGIWGNECKSK